MNAPAKAWPLALLWSTLTDAWCLDIATHGYVEQMVDLLRVARASVLTKDKQGANEAEISAAREACAAVRALGVLPSRRAPRNWATFLRTDDAGMMIALVPQQACTRLRAKPVASPALRPAPIETAKAGAPLAEATRGRVERVKLADIDVSVVVRAVRIDPEHLAEMVEVRRHGVEFPLFPVFRDPHSGTRYMSDGHHRRETYLLDGVEEVDAVVYTGGKREAFLHALMLGRDLPRSTKDKQLCVETLLRDVEWVNWTNAVIAEKCIVDPKTVEAARRRLGLSPASRKAKDGRTYKERKKPDHRHAAEQQHDAVGGNREIPDCPPPNPPPAASTAEAARNLEVPVARPGSSVASGTPADIILDLRLDGTPIEIYDGVRTVSWRVLPVEDGRVRVEGRLVTLPSPVATRRPDVALMTDDGSNVTAAGALRRAPVYPLAIGDGHKTYAI